MPTKEEKMVVGYTQDPIPPCVLIVGGLKTVILHLKTNSRAVEFKGSPFKFKDQLLGREGF